MGESKRRKLLNSNYGKVRQLTPQQKLAVKGIEEVESALIELFTESYKEKGRGCLFSDYDSDTMNYVPLTKLLELQERKENLYKQQIKENVDEEVDEELLDEIGDGIHTLIDFVEHYNPEKCGVYCKVNPTTQEIFDTKLIPFGSMKRLALKNFGIPTSIDLSEYIDQDLLTRMDDTKLDFSI